MALHRNCLRAERIIDVARAVGFGRVRQLGKPDRATVSWTVSGDMGG